MQTDIIVVTFHIDGGADYFRMCTIRPGGTAVTDKASNYQRQSGNFCKSCAWLDRKIYEAWFTVGQGYRAKDYSADHSVVVAMGRRLCTNDIVLPGRTTVRSRHTGVMTGSLL